MGKLGFRAQNGLKFQSSSLSGESLECTEASCETKRLREGVCVSIQETASEDKSRYPLGKLGEPLRKFGEFGFQAVEESEGKCLAA